MNFRRSIFGQRPPRAYGADLANLLTDEVCSAFRTGDSRTNFLDSKKSKSCAHISCGNDSRFLRTDLLLCRFWICQNALGRRRRKSNAAGSSRCATPRPSRCLSCASPTSRTASASCTGRTSNVQTSSLSCVHTRLTESWKSATACTASVSKSATPKKIMRRTGARSRRPRFVDARFFQMPAELVSHRRKQLVLEISFAARTETLVKRGG